MSITEVKLKTDFLKWLMNDTIIYDFINNKMQNILSKYGGPIFNIQVFLHGINQNSNENIIANVCWPNTTCNSLDNNLIIPSGRPRKQYLQITDKNVSTVPIPIQSSNPPIWERNYSYFNQINARGLNLAAFPPSKWSNMENLPIEDSIVNVPLYWVNAAIGLDDTSNNPPPVIKEGGTLVRCDKEVFPITAYTICQTNDSDTKTKSPQLYLGNGNNDKTEFNYGCRVGPCILSASNQYTFATDENGLLYLVGTADQNISDDDKQFLFGQNAGNHISPIVYPFLSYLDSPTISPNGCNDIYFDFHIPFQDFLNVTELTAFTEIFDLFIQTSPEYLQAFCLNNQNINTFFQMPNCFEKDGSLKQNTYFRANDDKPSDGCNIGVSQWCNQIGKIVDKEFCGCYVDPPVEITNIINSNGKVLCAAPDLSGNVNCSDGEVPRQCILPSCMNGNAFRPSSMKDQSCGALASIGYVNNNEDVNFKNSKLMIKYGKYGGNATMNLDVKENFTLEKSNNPKLSTPAITAIVLSVIFVLIIILAATIILYKKK